MPFGNPEQITRGYRTAVVFDKFGSVITQPYFAWQRQAAEMARGSTGPQSNVAYLPAVGMALRPHQMDPSKPYESTVAQSGFLTGSAVQVPPAITSFFASRTHDYTGVTYSGVAGQGNPMFQKRVASGSTWDVALTADQTGFPGPDVANDPVHLDRVLASVLPHDPRDFLTFQIHVPGAPHERPGAVATVYFNGPAGSVGAEVGFGQYGLKLHTDGLAVLWERGDPGTGIPSWFKRWQFVYSPVPASGMAFYITVGSDCVMGDGGAFVGTRLVFRTLLANEIRAGAGLGEKLISSFTAAAAAAISSGLAAQVFTVPQKTVNPVSQALIRIDARRDVRVMFSVSKHTYPTLGTLVDDSFTVPFHATTAQKLRLEWYGNRPVGTAVTVKVFSDFPLAELIGTVTVDDEFGQIIEYTPVPNARNYHVEFTLTGDGTNTPTIKKYRVYRDAVVETPGFTPTTVQDLRAGPKTLPTLFPSRVRLSGVSDDPESENMFVQLEDLLGENLALPFKSGTPFDVELHDAGTDALVTILEGGIIQRSTQLRYGTKGKDYPKSDAYRLEIDAAGEWAQVKRRLLPYWFYANDPADPGQPIKATDAAVLLFYKGCGIPLTDLDIPDLPQRLFSEVDGEDLQAVEPGTPVFETIKEIVTDYTGGYIVRDKNAGHSSGTRGMWRILLRHRPPYNNLVKIYRDHPGAGKLPHDIRSYADGSGPGGQVIKATYGVHGSETVTHEPPEGNFVQVFGGSGQGSSVGLSHPAMLTQVAFNPVSFNYFGLAPGHAFYPDQTSPDFLGECVQIQVYDATLTTQESVDWICRRIFDSACYGREVVKVTCPIVLVTDVNDTLQQRPRLPRFNDPVLYQQPDGSFAQYLIVSCTPNWSYDGFITADFELVTTTNIDTYGLPISAFDAFDLSRARIRAAKTAVGLPSRSRQSRTRQREFSVKSAAITAWPAGIPTEIQYLDPGVSNFGQFKYMVDYDPVP